MPSLKTKAKYKGECQACGARQKLPNDLLSNHGYKVNWGVFDGICPGSKHLPYEKSCGYIESCINSAKQTKESLESQIEKLKENNTNSSLYHKYIERGKRIWIEVEVINNQILSKENGERVTDPMRESLYGSDLEIARELDKRKIEWIKRKSLKIDEYIKWQEGRIRDWAQKDLESI